MYRFITDRDIEAFIDNELSREDEKEVIKYLGKNLKARKKYYNLLRQKRLLQKFYNKIK